MTTLYCFFWPQLYKFSETAEEFFLLCMFQINYNSSRILIKENCLRYDWIFLLKIKKLFSESGQELFCLKGLLLSVALFQKLLLVI